MSPCLNMLKRSGREGFEEGMGEKELAMHQRQLNKGKKGIRDKATRTAQTIETKTSSSE